MATLFWVYIPKRNHLRAKWNLFRRLLCVRKVASLYLHVYTLPPPLTPTSYHRSTFQKAYISFVPAINYIKSIAILVCEDFFSSWGGKTNHVCCGKSRQLSFLSILWLPVVEARVFIAQYIVYLMTHLYLLCLSARIVFMWGENI